MRTQDTSDAVRLAQHVVATEDGIPVNPPTSVDIVKQIATSLEVHTTATKTAHDAAATALKSAFRQTLFDELDAISQSYCGQRYLLVRAADFVAVADVALEWVRCDDKRSYSEGRDGNGCAVIGYRGRQLLTIWSGQ